MQRSIAILLSDSLWGEEAGGHAEFAPIALEILVQVLHGRALFEFDVVISKQNIPADGAVVVGGIQIRCFVPDRAESNPRLVTIWVMPKPKNGRALPDMPSVPIAVNVMNPTGSVYMFMEHTNTRLDKTVARSFRLRNPSALWGHRCLG